MNDGVLLVLGINRCNAAPTSTGFAEIVSDDFPVFHLITIGTMTTAFAKALAEQEAEKTT